MRDLRGQVYKKKDKHRYISVFHKLCQLFAPNVHLIVMSSSLVSVYKYINIYDIIMSPRNNNILILSFVCYSVPMSIFQRNQDVSPTETMDATSMTSCHFVNKVAIFEKNVHLSILVLINWSNAYKAVFIANLNNGYTEKTKIERLGSGSHSFSNSLLGSWWLCYVI